MGRPSQVAKLCRQGLTPAEIADELGISFSSAVQYLETAVGQGLLRRSDIYFTLPVDARRSPRSREERETVSRFGSAGHALGDLYEDLRHIETILHQRLRSALEAEFGEGEHGWWLHIPIKIRNSCNERCEEDDRRLEPYCYTDLLDLASIIEKNWSVLQREVGAFASDRKLMLSALVKLNEIRKMVMHPTRGMTPKEVDFWFIRQLRGMLAL